MRFFDNSESFILDWMITHLPKSKKLVIITSYVKMDGLVLIHKELRNSCKNGLELILCTGLHYFNAEPEALLRILRLTNKYNGKVLSFLPKKGIFHPKVFTFYKLNGEIHSLVGSGNLTWGGLLGNVELSVAFNSIENNECINNIEVFQNKIINEAKAFNEDDLKIYQKERAKLIKNH